MQQHRAGQGPCLEGLGLTSAIAILKLIKVLNKKSHSCILCWAQQTMQPVIELSSYITRSVLANLLEQSSGKLKECKHE